MAAWTVAGEGDRRPVVNHRTKAPGTGFEYKGCAQWCCSNDVLCTRIRPGLPSRCASSTTGATFQALATTQTKQFGIRFLGK